MPSRGDSLAARVQRTLERFYDLDALPGVDAFARGAGKEEREAVLVRESQGAGNDGHVEIAVVLPAAGLAPAVRELALDEYCQIIEGVSHFVYLAHSIRAAQRATQLELELQAEVDKFVLLAFAAVAQNDIERARAIHTRLYERVSFAHDELSEAGARYRFANELAARFCARLGNGRKGGARATLLRFYRLGQEEKIRLARAA